MAHTKAVWDNGGMDLNKSANAHTIGNFWLTAAMLVVMVWPLIFAPKAKAGEDPKISASIVERGVLVQWIMPGVLALALIVAGTLHFAATRVKKPRESNTLPVPIARSGHPVEVNAVFHARPDLKGRRIERALFGVDERKPYDVTAAVQKRVADGKEVVVNFECVGLKENPFEYEPKYLTVLLSVTHSESERVSLPFDWLNGLTNPLNTPAEPPPYEPKSPVEFRTYNALQTEFVEMPWSQKLALRLIYQKPGVDIGSLVREVEYYGFGKDAQNDIVLPLINKERFVSGSTRNIRRHPDPLNHKIVEELLAGWERHPF